MGDGGYACRNYIITPYRTPNTAAQRKYNKALSGTRASIEKCFGVWKKRFPILANKSRIHVQNLLTIIVSTAVLHNIAIDIKDTLDFDDQEEVEVINEHINFAENASDTMARNLITRAFE